MVVHRRITKKYKLKVKKVQFLYEIQFLQKKIPVIVSVGLHKKNMKKTKLEN